MPEQDQPEQGDKGFTNPDLEAPEGVEIPEEDVDDEDLGYSAVDDPKYFYDENNEEFSDDPEKPESEKTPEYTSARARDAIQLALDDVAGKRLLTAINLRNPDMHTDARELLKAAYKSLARSEEELKSLLLAIDEIRGKLDHSEDDEE